METTQRFQIAPSTYRKFTFEEGLTHIDLLEADWERVENNSWANNKGSLINWAYLLLRGKFAQNKYQPRHYKAKGYSEDVGAKEDTFIQALLVMYALRNRSNMSTRIQATVDADIEGIAFLIDTAALAGKVYCAALANKLGKDLPQRLNWQAEAATPQMCLFSGRS